MAQLGDQYGVATTHMNLGSAFYGMQDFDEALREYQQALRISMRMNNVQQIASAFNSMGLAMEGMDQLDEAQEARICARWTISGALTTRRASVLVTTIWGRSASRRAILTRR